MENVNFLGVEIQIDGEVNLGLLNLGAITLKKENREYILDIVSSISHFEDGLTTISCKVEVDKEIFDECKYDLTTVDLFCLDVAEIFITTEDNKENIEYQTENQTLFVKINNMTKAIDLTLED